MAAPATTARVTPAGIFLHNGYQTLIAFAKDSDVSIWEKTLDPPALDGGDPIDITTMHNTTVTTTHPRTLWSLNEHTFTGAYDPDAYNNVKDNLLNVNGSVTVHFPDGSTLDYWGYLRIFAPGTNERGSQPEATCTVTPTNYDPVNRVEAVPVLTSVVGT